MKNKTLAAWLALLGGPLGLHRFYLHGWRNRLGWALTVPTLIGLYGLWRVRQWGVDDTWSWLLIPPLGFTIAGCALTAIVYGLMGARRWNGRFNPRDGEEQGAGDTGWLTIGAVVLALFVGTIALISALALTFQRMFEYQGMAGS
jgi:TM2 domain